ncbi:unnamed protein product [Lota lota]
MITPGCFQAGAAPYCTLTCVCSYTRTLALAVARLKARLQGFHCAPPAGPWITRPEGWPQKAASPERANRTKLQRGIPCGKGISLIPGLSQKTAADSNNTSIQYQAAFASHSCHTLSLLPRASGRGIVAQG